MQKCIYTFSMLVFASMLMLFAGCETEKAANSVEPVSDNYGLGLRPASAATLAALPTAAAPGVSGTLPSRFMLNAPPPENLGQGQQGSCVGWATAYGLMGYYMGNGASNTDYSKVGSPAYVFNQIKISDCSNGAYIWAAFDLLKNRGVCTWNAMPYRDSDCSQQPSQTQNNNASSNRINSYSKITDLSEYSLKSILYSEKPIVIGFHVYENFFTIGRDVLRSKSGSLRGGHAVLIMGYDDAKHAYKVLNSWGNNWGDSGYFWLDYDFVSQIVFEAYLAEVSQHQNTTCNAPTGLQAANVTATTCNIAWTPVAGATRYQFLWYNNSGQWEPLWTTTAPNTPCASLSPSAQYCFAVKAECSNGWSDQSQSICITTQNNTVNCGRPAGVQVYDITQNSCMVSANSVSGADSYSVWQYDGFNWYEIANRSTPDFYLTGLQPNSNYTVAVSAYCSGVSGARSSANSFATLDVQATCDPVNNIWIDNVGRNWCVLAWNPVSNASTYRLYWDNNGTYTYIQSCSNPSIYIENMFPSSQYCFLVVPVCNGNQGDWSAPICVTTTNKMAQNSDNIGASYPKKADIKKAISPIDIHKRIPKLKPKKE